jgi:hypothetical protein
MSDQKTLDLRALATPKRRRPWRKAVSWAALIAAILIVLGVAGLIAWKLWIQKPDLNNVTVVKHLVSRHYILPTNEEPALATVTDSTKLQTAFLKHAKNGDKLLIYQANSTAIIYRPSADRIVAVGPVDIQPAGPGSSPESPINATP